VEGSFKGKSGETRKAVQFIDDQIKSYEDKLSAAENTVKEFKLKHTGLLPRQGTDYGSQLMQSSDALNAARLELAEAEQARNAITSQISGDEPILGAAAGPAAVDNPELDGRITALNKVSTPCACNTPSYIPTLSLPSGWSPAGGAQTRGKQAQAE
jgi:hypothetical protein